jgi:predicted nucleic acid-binding protein
LIVVDASVVAHLVFQGSQTEAVEALHARDPEWAAPLLCRSELRSVAMKHVRAGNVAVESAVASVRAAEWVLARREFMVATDRVLSLADRSGCSSYDCEYVALAMELAVPLYTLDRQLLEAFPEVARRPEGS